MLTKGKQIPMTKALFEAIYLDLEKKIKNGEFPYQSFIPSENDLVAAYSCSRNTVRRALSILADEGLVQPIHGKGVRVIWRSTDRDIIGSLEGLYSFEEYAERNGMAPHTVVREFEQLVCGSGLSRYTGFAKGSKLYRVVRTRSLDGFTCQVDINYFLRESIPDLTPEIAQSSVYSYIEERLNTKILTSKRQITVELANEDDFAYLNLSPYNCVAIIESQTFSSEGLMFEFTQVRHNPDAFRYCAVSRR